VGKDSAYMSRICELSRDLSSDEDVPQPKAPRGAWSGSYEKKQPLFSTVKF